jgi:hypothetical protein
MSVISIGTTITSGLVLESDTSGELVIKTGPSATTALTIDASQNVAFAKTPTFPSATIINGVTYIWPAADGSSGDFLTTDGAGDLYWSAAAGLPPVTVTASTAITAVAGNHYVLTAATAATVTLPASPTISDTVWITVANSLVTNVVARNGKNIQGIAEDMTLNDPYAAAQLRFSDNTEGWILI